MENASAMDVLSDGRHSNVSSLLIEGRTASMLDRWSVTSSMQEDMMNLYGALTYFDFDFA